MTPENAAAAIPSDGALLGHCIDDRYRLEAVIGVGGLGSVYRATHTKLQRPVAVKLLHETFGQSQIQRGRFAREAKALAALQHPNIVAVLDFGVSEARPYLVMELLEGETLSQRLRHGPLELESAFEVVQQLLEALSFMHRARLVHRDVKPSNVFLIRTADGEERVKVLDLGLAKFTAAPAVNSDPTLTREGAILGTPAYMSPEQATGESVDARSDVYAVGVILFRMLSGRLPFEGDAIDQVRSHLIAPVPPLHRPNPDPEVDRALEAWIGRAMAKRREDRYADAGEMLRALAESFPNYVRSTLPAHELPDPFAVDALNASWLLSLTDASSDFPTLPRNEAVAPPPLPSEVTRTRDSVVWVGRALRKTFWTSVRVFAGVSVLLVLGAAAIITMMMRSDADRAELSALQRRVSDRLIERSMGAATSPGSAPVARQPSAAQPTPANQPEKRGQAEALEVSAEPPAAEPTRLSPLKDEAETEPHSPLITTAETEPAPLAVHGEVQPLEEPPSKEADEIELPMSNRLAAALARASSEGATALPAPRPAPQKPAVANTAPSVAKPEAADPWKQPLPPRLRAARKAALANGRGTENMVLALRDYNKAQRTDPRGHLLLGQLYLNRYWRADALSQLATALTLDPSARGAPEVLPALLSLVAHGEFAAQANRVIVSNFGAEALPALDAARAQQKDPKALARLSWLRSRLVAMR